jgi:hypothetical protein
MNDGTLEALFAKAKEAEAQGGFAVPPGFAAELWRQHQRREGEERSAIRTGILSVFAALAFLVALVGLNFNDLTGANEDAGYSSELSAAVWDFAGN